MRLVSICVALLAASVLIVPIGDACSISVVIWSLTSKSADPLFRFIENGKTGYIDPTGKVIVKPTAVFNVRDNSGGEFHEGVARVNDPDGAYRFVDRSGRLLFKTGYFTGDFSEGVATSAEDRVGRTPLWGFVNRAGKFVIESRYSSAHKFAEGLAAVSTSWAPGNTGYIDHSGSFVIPPKLSFASDFHEGLAAVIMDGPCQSGGGSGSCGFSEFIPTEKNATYGCKFAFIDKLGHAITDLRFDETGEFSEGLAPVRIAGKWGYLDKSGHVAIEPQFDYAYSFAESLAAVRSSDKSGFIDPSGKFVIQPQFMFAWNFSNRRAIVMENSKNGQPRYRFIDPAGQPAFPGTFEVATPFIHGLAAVSSNLRRGKGLVSYIDTSGKSVFTYRADPHVLQR
jgi:hypothetical protein